jgi:ketosteroid isomerase-like protein
MPYSPEEQSNLQLVERYFSALNAGNLEDAVTHCFADGITQEEYPNQLMPNGARRDLAGLREAAARGRAFMAGQHFEVVQILAAGSTVVVESIWTATVAGDAGPFKAGQTLRARFAQFFEFRRGRIAAIRNYDCFDPF